jgi:hypothetical protein
LVLLLLVLGLQVCFERTLTLKLRCDSFFIFSQLLLVLQFMFFSIVVYVRNVRFRTVLCEDEVLAKREGERVARRLKTVKPGDQRDESLCEAARVRSPCN